MGRSTTLALILALLHAWCSETLEYSPQGGPWKRQCLGRSDISGRMRSTSAAEPGSFRFGHLLCFYWHRRQVALSDKWIDRPAPMPPGGARTKCPSALPENGSDGMHRGAMKRFFGCSSADQKEAQFINSATTLSISFFMPIISIGW